MSMYSRPDFYIAAAFIAGGQSSDERWDRQPPEEVWRAQGFRKPEENPTPHGTGQPRPVAILEYRPVFFRQKAVQQINRNIRLEMRSITTNGLRPSFKISFKFPWTCNISHQCNENEVCMLYCCLISAKFSCVVSHAQVFIMEITIAFQTFFHHILSGFNNQ